MCVVITKGLEHAQIPSATITALKAATEFAWAKWEDERPEWRTKLMTLPLDVNGFEGDASAVLIHVGVAPQQFGRVPVKHPEDVETALLKHLREKFPPQP